MSKLCTNWCIKSFNTINRWHLSAVNSSIYFRGGQSLVKRDVCDDLLHFLEQRLMNSGTVHDLVRMVFDVHVIDSLQYLEDEPGLSTCRLSDQARTAAM